MTERCISAVTVVVPVKNEEQNLPACLAALKPFHYVLVVDSNSSDRTPIIVEEAGARLINFSWDGKFPKKRNWVLQHHKFQTDWVLFIDADEVVTQAFCDELKRAISTTSHSGFWLNYTNYFMGRRLHYGVPQRKLSLFKIGSGVYERIDEDCWSNLDMEIHEHPLIEGTVGELDSPIDHRDFRGLARFLERHIDYARWEALRYIQIRPYLHERSLDYTSRQLFKYRNINSRWFASFYFIYTYIVRLGILDGLPGYKYACYKKWYFQTVRNLIREQMTA